jgi:hypothetical protein
VLIVIGITLTLAVLRLYGSVAAMQHESQQITMGNSLRGVNVGEVEVYDARTNHLMLIADVISGKASLLIVTDPACATCDERLRELVGLPEFPWDHAVVVVRGQQDAASELAKQLPASVRVIAEEPGLALKAFTPPFATVLDGSGTYVASNQLGDRTAYRQAVQTLSNQQARERMGANGKQWLEVGMVSSR